MLTLEANHVNLWHTTYLGVFRYAESKSAVCQAQKWTIRSVIEQIQDGRHKRKKLIFLLCTLSFTCLKLANYTVIIPNGMVEYLVACCFKNYCIKIIKTG